MSYAAITGWGKCMPPAILDNEGLATFLDTSDEWITTRTGIKERRISHVPMTVLSHISAARALACAGLDARDLDLVVLGSHDRRGLERLLKGSVAEQVLHEAPCAVFIHPYTAKDRGWGQVVEQPA